MKKIALLLSAALCTFSLQALAADSTTSTEEAKESARLEQKFANDDKQEGFAKRLVPEESQKDEKQSEETLAEVIAQMPADNYVETISAVQMRERLEKNPAEDLLYMKINEETVLVYEGLLGDKASCSQLVYASPNEHIINVYSNSPKLSKQMWKVVKSNKGEWKAVGGYTVVGAKSPEVKLENGGTMCKFWFEKVKSDSRRLKIKRRGLGLPVSIGATIPIGGGHHRPRIGIGL
ncbi:MAG: hypothetical protein MJ050_02025 [Phascolarctobacterium sp.]|nr:hypothetical protein [Phascolarctobacterium sp.]